jgi:hypothetical protein
VPRCKGKVPGGSEVPQLWEREEGLPLATDVGGHLLCLHLFM